MNISFGGRPVAGFALGEVGVGAADANPAVVLVPVAAVGATIGVVVASRLAKSKLIGAAIGAPIAVGTLLLWSEYEMRKQEREAWARR